jgi:outer membrane protein assembly factor BamB
VSSLSLSWIGNGFGPGLVFHSSPAVVKGLAYIGSDDGNLYAFNANGCGQPSCRPVWTGPLGQSIFPAPAVDGGLVFVASASSEGKLAAFKSDGCGQPTCQPVWTATLPGSESSPVVVNGILYVDPSFEVSANRSDSLLPLPCSSVWVRSQAFTCGI